MSSDTNIEWQISTFNQLSVSDLYAVLKARNEVFVVEQNCPYLDIDGVDETAHHMLGWGQGRLLGAYLRILPPGSTYIEASIGRVLTTKNFRQTGLGRLLMQRGIDCARKLYSHQPVRVQAQCYLEKFYTGFGFAVVSQPYDEDGVPHIDMLLSA